jgi:hypothetical protein
MNEKEVFYHLPVSTESGFHSLIEPIVEKYGLTLADWGTCVEVNKDNLVLFLDEMKVIRQAIPNLIEETTQEKSHYLGRIRDLAIEVERLINERADIRLLIG